MNRKYLLRFDESCVYKRQVMRQDSRTIGKYLKDTDDSRFQNPSGINWGYNGQGPWRLAMKIINDLFGSDTSSITYPLVAKLVDRIIYHLPHNQECEITEAEIFEALSY